MAWMVKGQEILVEYGMFEAPGVRQLQLVGCLIDLS